MVYQAVVNLNIKTDDYITNIANAAIIPFLVKARLIDACLPRQRLFSELRTGLHLGGRPLLHYKVYLKATLKS